MRQALYRGRAHLTLAVEEWRISGYLALVYRTASVLLCPRARLALRRAAIAAAVAARAQVDKGASLVHEGAVGAGARPRHADTSPAELMPSRHRADSSR